MPTIQLTEEGRLWFSISRILDGSEAKMESPIFRLPFSESKAESHCTMYRFDETKNLFIAYAKWRDAVDRTEGNETVFGSNAEISEIARDLREDAEFELRILIQDLKKQNPAAIKEWVELTKQFLNEPEMGVSEEQMQLRKQIARDWKYSRSPLGVSVRYPHPSQYWGSGIGVLGPDLDW
ncbi:hypothetical protein [Leptospira levettii]|uniref:hypothetical protein n=1 Tax=Leptospira levettii TaxID=2023178 RepID=UPI001EFA1396|nr:hypothetical protein [Leptospira levettii]MCW7495172.1 hypothetical protein [Leptospira levettii]